MIDPFDSLSPQEKIKILKLTEIGTDIGKVLDKAENLSGIDGCNILLGLVSSRITAEPRMSLAEKKEAIKYLAEQFIKGSEKVLELRYNE